MRSPLPLLLLLPSLAVAQQTTPTLTLGFGTNQNTTNTGRRLTLGAADCATDVSVTWSINTVNTGQVCENLTLWVQPFAETCPVAPSANSLVIEELTASEVNSTPALGGDSTSAHGATVTFGVSELLAAVAPTAGGVKNACGADVQETRSFRICGYTKSPTGQFSPCTSSQDLKSTPGDLQFVYDHERPAPPVPTVRGGDAKLVVKVADADDIASVRIQYRAEAETEFRDADTGDPVEEFEITGLTNGVDYFVRASQTDLAGNVSDFSAEVPGTPVEVQDFWERYEAAGGTDQGGCAAGGGAGLTMGAALAGVALWLASRRRAS